MLEIIREPDALASLEDAWNRLAEPFRTPLLQNDWLSSCARAFYRPGQLHVFITTTAAGISAAAPLVLVRNRFIKRFEFLGSRALGEPCGLICQDKESLRELIAGILETGHPLILARMPAKSEQVRQLAEFGRKPASLLPIKNAGTPFLKITGSWHEFEKGMSSRRRYDLRRAMKRAKNFGNVKFEIITPDVDNLEHYFNELVQVEASGWKGRAGTALLQDEKRRNFFYLYSRKVCRSSHLRLCFLRIDGKTAAALLGVISFNRFWVLKIGYDEAFAKCSPGILLIHETIRHAFEHGMDGYEFLGSDEPWIRMWTDRKHDNITVRLYPFTLKGFCSRWIDYSASMLKRSLLTRNERKV